MREGVRLLNVELDGDDGVLVIFSDGTTGAYVAEELLELRPYREQLTSRKNLNVPSEGPKHDNPGAKAQRADCQRVREKASHSRH